MIRTIQVSGRSWRVWERNRDVFLALWTTDALPVLLEPLVILAVMGLGVGRVVDEIDGVGYLEYIGPGVLAGYAMFAPSFENSWGSYVRMAVRRTYDAIIVTPLSIEDVITGEILWGTTRALVTASVILLILAAMGNIGSPLAALVPPLVLLEGFMFACIAITYTALAPSVQAFNYFFSLFIYPMFFLSGVFFPLRELPDALERFAWVLPLTPAVHVARNLFDGELTLSMLWSVLGMAAAAAAFYYLALVAMRRRLIR